MHYDRALDGSTHHAFSELEWRLFAASASVDEAGLRLLTKDDFYTFLEDCGDKLAVIDFFTDWCNLYPIPYNSNPMPRAPEGTRQQSVQECCYGIHLGSNAACVRGRRHAFD